MSQADDTSFAPNPPRWRGTGMPEITEAERAALRRQRPGPVVTLTRPAHAPAPLTPEQEALVDQLVRWGGYTRARAKAEIRSAIEGADT